MKEDVLQVFTYFDKYEQSLSKEELLRFLPKQSNLARLEVTLNKLVESKKVKWKKNRYALNEVSLNKYQKNFETAQKLKLFAQKYINFLIKSPLIRGISISGSVAMNDASKSDDIDFFIITAKKMVWLARFFTLVTARIYLFWHHKPSNLFCLNLFFEAESLMVPKNKQNLEVAYEIMKLVPIVDKSRIFQQFYNVNSWTLKYFPNRKDVKNTDIFSDKEVLWIVHSFKFLNFAFKIPQIMWLRFKKVSFEEHNGQIWLC